MRRSDTTMTIHTTDVGRLGAPVANDDGTPTQTIRRAASSRSSCCRTALACDAIVAALG
jgi:hypothetical protein